MNFGRKICQNDVEFLVTYNSLLRWNKISGFQITKIELLLLRKFNNDRSLVDLDSKVELKGPMGLYR